MKQNSGGGGVERTTAVLDNIHGQFFSDGDKKETSRAFRFKQYFIGELEKELES